MLEKLKELALRYEDLQAQLADPSVCGQQARGWPLPDAGLHLRSASRS